MRRAYPLIPQETAGRFRSVGFKVTYKNTLFCQGEGRRKN
jgi:hypothetical protein